MANEIRGVFHMITYIIVKTHLDFEGYPQQSTVMTVKQSKEEAEKYIESMPKPELCKCGEHTNFEYKIEERVM